MRTILVVAAICLMPTAATAAKERHPHEHHHSVADARDHRGVRHTRRHHRAVHEIAKAKSDPAVTRLKADLVRGMADVQKLRAELAQVRAQVDRRPDSGWDRMIPMPPGSRPVALAALTPPDLRLPVQPPAVPPVQMPERVVSEAVDEARAYLLRTAYPGDTMSRQGPKVALGRLHPEFALRLAGAIRAARAEGILAGVFSAYRPPVFGVGGFSDKFNSLHSYGLAADVAGIDRPGSGPARRFAHILAAHGLFLPYGPDNHAEWNHVQLISTKMASERLRGTITASAPRDLWVMWAASGVAVPKDELLAGAERSAAAKR